MNKEYSPLVIATIKAKVETLIRNHDKFELRELLKNEPYALEYFVSRAIEDMATLEHIKSIIK